MASSTISLQPGFGAIAGSVGGGSGVGSGVITGSVGEGSGIGSGVVTGSGGGYSGVGSGATGQPSANMAPKSNPIITSHTINGLKLIRTCLRLGGYFLLSRRPILPEPPYLPISILSLLHLVVQFLHELFGFLSARKCAKMEGLF